MKKVFLLSVLLSVSVISFSQIFSLGVKAGYNTSLGFDDNWNFSGSNVSMKSDLANGFHAGLYARVGRTLYFQPEVLYNYSKYNQTVGGVHHKIVNSTFDVPLLLGWSIVNGKAFKLRIMAGPKFSFNAGSTDAESYWDGVKANARTARLGLDTGIGIDVWRFTLDLRYNLMNNLYSFEDKTSSDEVNKKPNNSFAISLGFRLFGNNMKK